MKKSIFSLIPRPILHDLRVCASQISPLFSNIEASQERIMITCSGVESGALQVRFGRDERGTSSGESEGDRLGAAAARHAGTDRQTERGALRCQTRHEGQNCWYELVFAI